MSASKFQHLVGQLAHPPTDMVMPAANLYVTVANFAILLVVTLLLTREARRTRSWLPLLCLLGAAIASLQEPIYDMVGSVWYPNIGQTPLLTVFGVSVSLWLLPAYAWYIGGQGYWMFRNFEHGMTRSGLWRCYALFWLANFALEIPGLQLGIYAYYGEQPFRLLGFPLWMAMTNALMPIVLGLACHRLRHILQDLRVLLVVPLVPMCIGFAQIAVGWPVWLALNAGQGPLLTHAAATVAMGLSLMVVYLAAELVGGEAPADTRDIAIPRLSKA